MRWSRFEVDRAGIGCPLLLAAVLVVVAVPATAESFDAGLYDGLLARFTLDLPGTGGVRVDYAGLAGSADWPRLVGQLASSDPDSTRSRAERIAFWINAYNILAIDLVVSQKPASSIRDLGSWLRPVWKRAAGTIAGESYSLDRIEHDILRPLGEPRIHGAIVCASISCPPLLRETWRADSLPQQFARSFERWLADPATGLRIDAATGTLYLSRVFDWFEADFAAEGGVLAVIGPYLPESARAWLARNPAPRVDHLEYDWRLNAATSVGPAD